MTKLLEQAIEKAKALPESRQDELGEMIMALVEQDELDIHLSPEQQAEVRRRLSDPGPLASNDDVQAVIRKLTAE
ncbi:MAG: hypothetical protein ACR2PM_04570 [Hyphomicrobiales bacterium]